MDFDTNRRLSDSEIAIGVSEAILNSKFNPGRDLPFQPGEFLVRLGIQPRSLPSQFHEANPHNELEFRVAEYCWRLVGLGYLIPQVSSGWGVFYVTNKGRDFLGSFDQSAVTRDGLDYRLETIGYKTHDLVRRYVSMAQDCFLAGHNEASVVMLGAATEHLVQQIVEALEAANSHLRVPFRSRTDRPTARQNLAWLTDATTVHKREVVRALEGSGRDTSWVDPLSDVISGTGQAIRLTRNELGHPTGIQVTQEDALQLFTLFPRLAEISLKATDGLALRP